MGNAPSPLKGASPSFTLTSPLPPHHQQEPRDGEEKRTVTAPTGKMTSMIMTTDLEHGCIPLPPPTPSPFPTSSPLPGLSMIVQQPLGGADVQIHQLHQLNSACKVMMQGNSTTGSSSLASTYLPITTPTARAGGNHHQQQQHPSASKSMVHSSPATPLDGNLFLTAEDSMSGWLDGPTRQGADEAAAGGGGGGSSSLPLVMEWHDIHVQGLGGPADPGPSPLRADQLGRGHVVVVEQPGILSMSPQLPAEEEEEEEEVEDGLGEDEDEEEEEEWEKERVGEEEEGGEEEGEGREYGVSPWDSVLDYKAMLQASQYHREHQSQDDEQEYEEEEEGKTGYGGPSSQRPTRRGGSKQPEQEEEEGEEEEEEEEGEEADYVEEDSEGEDNEDEEEEEDDDEEEYIPAAEARGKRGRGRSSSSKKTPTRASVKRSTPVQLASLMPSSSRPTKGSLHHTPSNSIRPAGTGLFLNMTLAPPSISLEQATFQKMFGEKLMKELNHYLQYGRNVSAQYWADTLRKEMARAVWMAQALGARQESLNTTEDLANMLNNSRAVVTQLYRLGKDDTLPGTPPCSEASILRRRAALNILLEAVGLKAEKMPPRRKGGSSGKENIEPSDGDEGRARRGGDVDDDDMPTKGSNRAGKKNTGGTGGGNSNSKKAGATSAPAFSLFEEATPSQSSSSSVYKRRNSAKGGKIHKTPIAREEERRLEAFLIENHHLTLASAANYLSHIRTMMREALENLGDERRGLSGDEAVEVLQTHALPDHFLESRPSYWAAFLKFLEVKHNLYGRSSNLPTSSSASSSSRRKGEDRSLAPKRPRLSNDSTDSHASSSSASVAVAQAPSPSRPSQRDEEEEERMPSTSRTKGGLQISSSNGRNITTITTSTRTSTTATTTSSSTALQYQTKKKTITFSIGRARGSSSSSSSFPQLVTPSPQMGYSLHHRVQP